MNNQRICIQNIKLNAAASIELNQTRFGQFVNYNGAFGCGEPHVPHSAFVCVNVYDL